MNDQPVIEYDKWENGMLAVKVDGQFVGYLSEDADGWVFWRQAQSNPKYFELVSIAPTRKQAIHEAVAAQ